MQYSLAFQGTQKNIYPSQSQAEKEKITARKASHILTSSSLSDYVKLLHRSVKQFPFCAIDSCSISSHRAMNRQNTSLSVSALIKKKRFYPLQMRTNNQHQIPLFHQPFASIRALSLAPFACIYTQDASFMACAEVFFENNTLLAATLQPATRVKYTRALENFRTSTIANELTELSLDHRLAIYIQERFLIDSRPGQRQEISNLICAILLMYPALRDQLGLARRTITGWKTLKPSQSSAPFTWYMISQHQFEATTVLIISFAACLRMSEAFYLTWKHVALLRLAGYPSGTAGLNIKDAKTARYTGKLQFVKVTDLHATKWIFELRKAASATQLRLAKISYQQYVDALKQAATHFGLNQVPLTSHSARIGKETDDFIKGILVEQIAINGRWKSINSLRYYYLNNGGAWILDTSISTEKQARLIHAANQLNKLLRV